MWPGSTDFSVLRMISRFIHHTPVRYSCWLTVLLSFEWTFSIFRFSTSWNQKSISTHSGKKQIWAPVPFPAEELDLDWGSEREARESTRDREIYIYIKIRHARMTNVLRNCREFLSVLLNGLRVAFVWETSHFSYAKINRCEHSQPSIIQSRRIYMEAGLRADGYGKYEKERKTEQLRGENIQVPVHWPLV